jgi:hypothetical protein
MEMQQQKVQNQTQNEEDVLNFDLDDISLEDIDQQSSGNEEDVIELTDLVARGMPVEDAEEDEIVELLEEDQISEEEGDGEFKLMAEDLAGLELGDELAEEKQTAESDIADFALEFDLAQEEKQRSAEEMVSEEPVSRVEFEEDILKEEEVVETVSEVAPSEEMIPEAIASLEDLGGAPQKSTPDQPDVISEDFLKDEAFSPAAPEMAAEPLAAGISEEKLEEIVTKVVQDVLERVARETMASVAERVIGEAIESLKKSQSENP